MSKEIAEEYASSLADLTVNSKPLINMLTILAEENVEHAGVIVETVEKHLEKVHPEIKLPVLYLVDSIIKNVGGAYNQKFSQSIVNMFTRTFKQVDEKVRSQMFKLRETWHDVFPATKLYQLDVKVNLIDPAWPIQAQPQQSNIHVNPNFLKKNATTSSPSPPSKEDEEKMRSILAKKEQELLMLQRKKIEMELEQTKRQLEMAEKNAKRVAGAGMPVATVNPVPALAPVVSLPPDVSAGLSVKSRLGPPVNKPGGRIAPVSGALAAARRDPRLARHALAAAAPRPAPGPGPGLGMPPGAIAPNVFDIKPLDRVHKRKNVITIDVAPGAAPAAAPRRRDPRLDKRRDKPRRADDELARGRARARAAVDELAPPDPLRIMKLPPIPRIVRDEPAAPAASAAPAKRRKEAARDKKKRPDDANGTGGSSGSSPEKKARNREGRRPRERDLERERRAEPEPGKAAEPEVVAFKELRNYHKERYMRRNREHSGSPEGASRGAADRAPGPEPEPEPEPERTRTESPNAPDITETKDVDLRVLPAVAESKAAAIGQKRPSAEALEGKAKKNKLDKFDILFGNEDVDLRQLPQVDETAPPPPAITESPKNDSKSDDLDPIETSPQDSPRQKDWHEVKDNKNRDDTKKTPSKLDLVRAKLAEATKVKDGLGRPLLFSKSPSIERERRRTLSSEDMDIRSENPEDFDADDHKKTISIIMNQAKEQYTDGKLDKNQYNTLMYQVLQLNEKLKLKEAKQRESLEISKRKLKAHIHEENHKVPSPKSSPSDRNNFGDIDERITPLAFFDTPPDSKSYIQDSDMRMNSMKNTDGMNLKGPPPMPPIMPPMYPPYQPMWRGPRPRIDEYVPRRFRGPVPAFFRGKFDNRPHRPPLPTPKLGMCQGESLLQLYVRSESPPPIGVPGFAIPPTDFKILEYIDHDPVKTIQIDGIPREIRFYGETAVIMLDWDDPREIKFLPGCRRVTFDNKDSVVLSFNEGYKQVEIDDQQFDIRFGAPTRELYINGRWYECFFGGQPVGVIIDGKPRLVHLEGPLPQVDIGKTKRTDLVAGKINLIVNATQMCPVYLDAKVQKFNISGQFFTIRFVDALRTVLINEQPFKVEYGDLPKPIFMGKEKYFIRFSALPRNIKPGVTQIVNMEGVGIPTPMPPVNNVDGVTDNAMEVDQEPVQRPIKTPSPDMNHESQGLDMLASVLPSSMAPASASGSEYSVAEPLFNKTDKIPGLETPSDEKPATSKLPLLGNINVTDLFAKLVATGIVKVAVNPVKDDTKEEPKAEEVSKPKDDKTVLHKVDLLRPETLRVPQPAMIPRLYGGMQCSGCGARFPPEQTVRYSQHLDWHFRQNRRDRDSARRAHSRHWHYDLADWLQYEELEDLEEREKSWFETGGAEGEGEGPSEVLEETPSVAAGAPADHFCALCGDKFDQFYNEDKEEWHLRNSVRHDAEDKNYHPMCFEDYKASLTKVEPEQEVMEEEKPVEVEEAIEIKDVDEEVNEPSDDESDVEVVDPEKDADDPVEIEELDDGDEDDVVFKAEPVEQVEVRDEDDTDDETVAERASRDRQATIDFASIKVKQEPIDPDDELIITAEEESMLTSAADTTHTTVLSSIDGNVQLDAASHINVLPGGGIRINISKTIPSFITNNHDDKMLEDISTEDEPLPPGEEPELEYALKPMLEGVQLSRQPPIQKGNELSGLCSIM